MKPRLGRYTCAGLHGLTIQPKLKKKMYYVPIIFSSIKARVNLVYMAVFLLFVSNKMSVL